MPHEFDYVVQTRERAVGDGATLEVPTYLELGPDSDEVWDILDIYVHVENMFDESPDDFTRAENWFQLSTNEELILEEGNLDTHDRRESSRLLWAVEGGLSAQVLDESNGLGAVGQKFEKSQHLRFDRGDLRIAFPGEVQLAATIDNNFGGGVAGVQSRATMSIHYSPSPRHE
jgi:hypothetical protein